ncbi:MAG: carboxylate--amine ligase [Acidobacteria bacterium]|nr:MAG: carboxylate--amine ligase [Acidobacteriota bacterium]
MKILVNDGVRPSLGVVRSLGRKGIRVGVLAESSFAPVLHSRYCTRQYLGPAPESEGFVAAVLDILRRELETLTRVEIMDEAKIRLAADKRHTHELASAAGVPAPRTVYPASLRDALARAAELEYPIVIKPCRETHGETVRYASSPAELPAVYRRFCEEKGFFQDNLPMLQEFIPGYGCGFFALYQHGVPKRIFMHRRIRENPPSGGVSTCAESFFDPRLKEYGVRLLDSLKWHGVAMVEFRRDSRDHDFKLMEINPRVWGSLDLALAAGVDFPYDLCQVIQGKQLEYSEDYHRAIRFHWPIELVRSGRP